MKKYNSYEDLLKENGVDLIKSNLNYARIELNNFLSCIGSNVVENENIEPETTFKLDIEGKILEIGITSIIDAEENIIYYYWLEV